MTVYKEINYLHIVNLSLLKELSTLNPIFEEFDQFTSHGGRILYFQSWNLISQDLHLYLESFLSSTTANGLSNSIYGKIEFLNNFTPLTFLKSDLFYQQWVLSLSPSKLKNILVKYDLKVLGVNFFFAFFPPLIPTNQREQNIYQSGIYQEKV